MKKLLLSFILLTNIFNVHASFGFGIKNFIDDITYNIVATTGYLFMTMAVVAFMWGIVEFIWAQRSGEEKEIKTGKELMKWGILALFVMFSIWGIIKFMQKTLTDGSGANFSQTDINVPQFRFNFSGSSNVDTAGPTNQSAGSQSIPSDSIFKAGNFTGYSRGTQTQGSSNYPADSCGADDLCYAGCIQSGQIISSNGSCNSVTQSSFNNPPVSNSSANDGIGGIPSNQDIINRYTGSGSQAVQSSLNGCTAINQDTVDSCDLAGGAWDSSLGKCCLK